MRIGFSRRGLCACALLTFAVIAGGGGSPAPLAELSVQLAALLVVLVALFLPDDRPRASFDGPVVGLCAVLVLLCALQLIPLPPALWQALPGREMELQALSLIGQGDSWRPFSVAPHRTLAALLSLVPPLAMLWLTARLDAADRSRLLLWIGLLGLLSVLVGAVQLSGGNAGWLRFYGPQRDYYLMGFQANRNATVDVLLIALVALIGWLFTRPHRPASVVAALTGAGALLGLGIVLTGSRTGMVLLAALMAIALAGLLWRFRRLPQLRLIGVGAIALGLISVWLLWDNPVLRESIVRFGQDQEERPDLWADTLYAIGQYWPAGSGMGTFRHVFLAAERLEVVDVTFANRAHNDYLEIALEAGLAGVLVVIAAIVALAWRLVARLRQPMSHTARAQTLSAIGVMLIILFHSIVDYPLRSLSLACLAAAGVAMLTRAAPGGADAPASKEAVDV